MFNINLLIQTLETKFTTQDVPTVVILQLQS